MVIDDTNGTPDNTGDLQWENPKDPESTADARDDEQIQRQYEEAKRRKENLTETDHIDKEKKTEE